MFYILISRYVSCTHMLCKYFLNVTVRAVTELDNKTAYSYTPISQRHRSFFC